MSISALSGKKILLGVCGGIAAYKAADFTSKLVQAGADVNVVMTKHAQNFVGPTTFHALTRNAVLTDLFDEPDSGKIAHIQLAQEADLILVCPATANIIAKMAMGLADDLLSTLILATRSKVIVAPAMNTLMWENPAVQNNIRILEERGIFVIQPDSGRLACGDVGAGKLPSTEQLLDICSEVYNTPLNGIKLLITAGPTEEPVDAVRCLTNRSSGKMGYALAQRALDMGADVTMISGPTNLAAPVGAQVISVKTTQQMYDAVMQEALNADIVIAAAAPSDYRIENPVENKMKKDGQPLTLHLVENPDIIAAAAGNRKLGQVFVAFAAETEQLSEHCHQKLVNKHVDMVVGNDISKPQSTFGSDSNEIILVTIDDETSLPVMSKADCASAILQKSLELLKLAQYC